MVYITVKQPPMYHQMTLDEFLFGTTTKSIIVNPNLTNTRTYEVESVSDRFLNKVSVTRLIKRLSDFNDLAECVRNMNRLDLYTTFYTEKKGKGMSEVFKRIYSSQHTFVHCDTAKVSSIVVSALQPLLREHKATEHIVLFDKASATINTGLEKLGFDVSLIDLTSIMSSAYRRINAPINILKEPLIALKDIFEEDFGALYHTSAFAYIKKRSTLDALKRHQANESKWFAKYDLSDFFGSTTLEFVMRMFSMVFPFSEVVKLPIGRIELENALELAFLNGGLPQGTPISPLITNIMMIPVDYKLANGLREFNHQRFVYTRYADDFTISSKYDFKFKEIESFIVDTLKGFDAPFTINSNKTRYGSSAGSNWNLGLVLNKDNKITVGHEKKRLFKAMVFSYVLDTLKGTPWSKEEVQVMEGNRNYYRMIEKDTIDSIIERIGQKFGVNVLDMIKKDLRA